MECCRLRVKDIDFSRNQIVVRAGTGGKDRYTMLPAAVKEPLLRHLQGVKRQHVDDLKRGLGRVSLPNALDRKYPNAGNATPSAIRLPLTCWKMVTMSALSRDSWIIVDVSTTMIYTHVLNRGGRGVRSPADALT